MLVEKRKHAIGVRAEGAQIAHAVHRLDVAAAGIAQGGFQLARALLYTPPNTATRVSSGISSLAGRIGTQHAVLVARVASTMP